MKIQMRLNMTYMKHHFYFKLIVPISSTDKKYRKGLTMKYLVIFFKCK